MASIKLYVFDEDVTDALYELTDELDVTFDETGGFSEEGHPEFEFTGERLQLLELIDRYAANTDGASFDDLMSRIRS